mgnify:CR=1 FL=1
MELVDIQDLKSWGFGRAGSIPAPGKVIIPFYQIFSCGSSCKQLKHLASELYYQFFFTSTGHDDFARIFEFTDDVYNLLLTIFHIFESYRTLSLIHI